MERRSFNMLGMSKPTIERSRKTERLGDILGRIAAKLIAAQKDSEIVGRAQTARQDKNRGGPVAVGNDRADAAKREHLGEELRSGDEFSWSRAPARPGAGAITPHVHSASPTHCATPATASSATARPAMRCTLR